MSDASIAAHEFAENVGNMSANELMSARAEARSITQYAAGGSPESIAATAICYACTEALMERDGLDTGGISALPAGLAAGGADDNEAFAENMDGEGILEALDE